MKQCNKCNTVKSNSDFYKACTNADGLCAHCKTCFAYGPQSVTPKVVALLLRSTIRANPEIKLTQNVYSL